MTSCAEKPADPVDELPDARPAARRQATELIRCGRRCSDLKAAAAAAAACVQATVVVHVVPVSETSVPGRPVVPGARGRGVPVPYPDTCLGQATMERRVRERGIGSRRTGGRLSG